MHKMTSFRSTENLRSMIDRLSRQTAKLQRMAVTIGTTRDNGGFRDKLNEEKDKGMELIHGIVGLIKQTGRDHPSVQSILGKFEREARQFQEVIERIKDDESRVVHQVNTDSVAEDDLTVGLLQEGNIQVDAKLSQLENKRTQIRNLESDVTELASMFKDLQGLVNDQQSSVDQITVHVEEAKVYTQNAASELEKAERYQRSARRRQLCCCILLLIVFIVIGLVIYLLVKK
mmetsp:Transcript_14373/g.35047  ORF Transcript_14373/g.35047 Transcript_14373/m.35047 type:complete len:231 (+) Transcript_14373:127-819(+)